MTRQFNIGRQSEMLMNDEQYNIYKAMKHLNEMPNNSAVGPVPDANSGDSIKNGALWLDTYSTDSSANLKFFKNGTWNMVFHDKFKITDHLLDEEEPLAPISSQLWIDSDGIMRYYDKGEFRPIKATMADIGSVNPLGFEDFIIIQQVDKVGKTVVDNFTHYLFQNTPIEEWKNDKGYTEHEGAIHGLNIYICRKGYSADENINILNKKYWVKLDILNQFIVPNANIIKMFIDGNFIHQDINMTILENGEIIEDPNEEGWKKESDVCVSFPIDMIEGKYPNGVHVNPTRLHDVRKRFIAIDKNNPIIEVPESNSEYYGMKGGIGRLLVKTNNEATTDYFSVTSSNIDCIKLSQKVAEEYDFIYAITYSFSNSKIKEKGVLYRKKFKLKDENYVWIDKVDADRIMVFAQGLYYENDPENYFYDQATGYLYIKEKLQDYQNMVKTFDFSVLYFPKIHSGRVTSVSYNANNYFAGKGYRISLDSVPKNANMIGFLKGLQMHIGDDEVNYYPSEDPSAVYIPSLTKKLVDDSGEAYWAIVETDEFVGNTMIHQFYRGKTKTINRDGSIIIPITRNVDEANTKIYVDQSEMPIVFIDGVLVFQKELVIGNDYISIYGLKEGQDVVVLGDTNSKGEIVETDGSEIEFNSDRVLFEDSVSYATIPTEFNDAAVVYLKNGILADASSVTTSIEPVGIGAHGEVRYWQNYVTDKWMIYDAITGRWSEIDKKLTVPNANGENILYTDYLDMSSRGYTATRNSLSFLQNLGEDYCTYYAYKYSDSIEKKLLLGYTFPNGRDGVNSPNPGMDDPIQFRTNFKHYYTPGKNEITVYFNGVRQTLASPNDINFFKSKARECESHKNNEFVLAHNDNTESGKALARSEGWYTYHLIKPFKETEVLIDKIPLSEEAIKQYEADGYTVVLVSKPSLNQLFYVIERCEGEEMKACERKILTFKNAHAAKGAFSSNAYDTDGFILTRGNIRVFINGLRQPYGGYQTVRSMNDHKRAILHSYKILDSETIQFEDPLIGGFGGNEGSDLRPKFPIGDIKHSDGTFTRVYHDVIDEILIETRRDFKLREITIPIKDNTGIFGINDGLPLDLFKTKDRVLIYINGLAYGKEYKIEKETIKLLNDETRQYLALSDTDVITFEWR